MIAHRIAQLDHMARGRFYWGVGSSSTPGDYEIFGFDPDGIERREYTRQPLDLILKIWEDPKPGLYESEHWRYRSRSMRSALRSTSRPTRRAHPPIAIPGGVPSLGHADHGRRARLVPDSARRN